MSNLEGVKKPAPISIRKVKDKFGFHKVYVYDGLESLTYLMACRIKEQENKQDSVYLVSGLEGTGKSIFTLWGAEIYGELVGEEVPIDNVCTSLQDMINRMATLKSKRSFLTLDEGSELGGDRQLEKKAKETKEIFTVMRKLSHVVFICFVNPLKIGTYFREDRVRGLFFVKKKGEVWFYANSSVNPHLIMIIDTWKKDHDAKTLKFLTTYAPDFILKNIPDYHGRLRKGYEEKKDGNIDRILEKHSTIESDSGLGIVEELEWLDVRMAAKFSGMTDRTIKEYIKRNVFSSVKMRNRIHVNKKELVEYMNGKLKKVNFGADSSV